MRHSTHSTMITMTLIALTAGLTSGCRGGQEQECPGWESGQQDTGDEASQVQGIDLESGAWFYEGDLPGADPVADGAYPCFELGEDHAVHTFTLDLDTEARQDGASFGPYTTVQDATYGTLSVRVGNDYQWAVARSYGTVGNSGYVVVEDRQTFDFETLAIAPCGG